MFLDATARRRDRIKGNAASPSTKHPNKGRYQIHPKAMIVSDKLIESIALNVVTPKFTRSRTKGIQSTRKRGTE